MNKQEVTQLIERKLAVAYNEMLECVGLADEHGVIFSLPWGGEGTSQSGMGADYVPDTATDYEKQWCDHTGWQPSAGSC
jgi:hypothetical protein